MESKDYGVTGDWNIESSSSTERSRSHYNVCFWEQNKTVYLRLLGGIIDPSNPCNGIITPFSIPLNQTYIFTAKVNTCPGATGQNILVVQTTNSFTNNTIQFIGGALVVAPLETPIKRPNKCNQVVRYIESNTTIQIDPYTFIDLDTNYRILAVNGMVQFVELSDDELSDEDRVQKLIQGDVSADSMRIVAAGARATSLMPVVAAAHARPRPTA